MLITISAAVLITSFISGVIGMAGGMILMGVLVMLLPVPIAMILHGLIQATSNGSRTWFLRHNIQWPIVKPYLIGSVLTFAALGFIAFMPDKKLIYILIGSLPFLTLLLPVTRSLDITNPRVAVGAGVIVTMFQIFAGVSGPLLDHFFVNPKLSRFEVIATKAFTQCFGHILKLFYYSAWVSFAISSELWSTPLPWALCIAAAFTGTYLSKYALEYLTDKQFHFATRCLVLAIGGFYLYQGVMM